jgi:hypothetical protein
MRALAVAIQDGRADLHLTVDELAERSGIPSDDIWRLLGEDLAAAEAERHLIDRPLLDGLAHGLHQRPEVLYRAALLDAGVAPPAEPAQADWFAGLTAWVLAD